MAGATLGHSEASSRSSTGPDTRQGVIHCSPIGPDCAICTVVPLKIAHVWAPGGFNFDLDKINSEDRVTALRQIFDTNIDMVNAIQGVGTVECDSVWL